MDLSKPTNNKNLGGNYLIKIIPIANVYKIDEAINGEIPSITVYDESEIYTVGFTTATLNKKVQKEYSNEGIIYSVSVNLSIPKNRLQIRNALSEIDLSDYILLVTDSNDKSEIFGELNNAMRLTDDNIDSGSPASDFNHYELDFTGKFNFRPYFLFDTFIINVATSSYSLGYSQAYQS